MKIGCISANGESLKPLDLSVIKETVFELEIVTVVHPYRYPEYEVTTETIAFSESRENAENLMQELLTLNKYMQEDIFCFNIYERPIDFEYSWGEYMASWVYEKDGQLMDKRLFPTFWSEGKFDGRSEDEIRFKWGDLVECFWGTSVELVYVLASPPGKEHYLRISKEQGKPYCGDDSDDSYTVINGPSYAYHSHVDALQLFKPHFPIPKDVMRKYKKMWKDYLKDLEKYRRDTGFNAPF